MIWLATYVGTRCVALALLVPQIELLADFTHYGKALANAGATLLAAPQSATVEHAACNCDELRASGVGTALLLAEIAFWAGLIGFALLLTLRWIVTNKAFSPQYMIGAAALMAAWGAMRGPALPRADTALLLAACALTQLLYPAHRAELSGSEPQAWPLAALTLRNVLPGAISVRVALQIWRETARRHG